MTMPSLSLFILVMTLPFVSTDINSRGQTTSPFTEHVQIQAKNLADTMVNIPKDQETASALHSASAIGPLVSASGNANTLPSSRENPIEALNAWTTVGCNTSDPTTKGIPVHSTTKSDPGADNRKILNIIGLFAMTGMYHAGISYVLASQLAVMHINNRTDILPGYKLQINAHNTNCEESKALDAFYEEVYNESRTSIMTLGGTCSPVTEITAQVSHLWGLLQISYSSVSPFLSNKKMFPSFYRVMTPEHYLTIGRLKLFTESGWKRVHVIYENYNVFSTLNEMMKQDLRLKGVDVASSEMFTNNPNESVRNLRDKDARIIIANMYEDKARQVACAAYNLEAGGNMTKAWYDRVVWLFPSFFDRHWLHVEDNNITCTSEQIRKVVGRYFSISSQSICQDEGYVTDSGLSPKKFLTEFNGRKLYDLVKDELPKDFQSYYTNDIFYPDGSIYNQHRSPEAYDAVWAIALALNNTLTYLIESGDHRRLEDFNYHEDNMSKIIKEGMCNVSFRSLSGKFSFNGDGDRTPGIEIFQFNNDENASYTSIGNCQFNGTSEEWICDLNKSSIVWRTKGIPVDGIQMKYRSLRIDEYLRNCFWILASVGVILSAGLLIFNVSNRTHRIVKMSSPRLNNVILIGCMLSYSTIFIMDIEGDVAQAACIVRTFTVVLSFSLSFGALFAKTWRVYEIFTAGHKVLNTRMLRDSSLFLIVALFVIVNSTVLVCWSIVSPQTPTLANISITLPSEETDIQYINQFQRCDSPHRVQFIWTLIAIQGVVIIFGTFLAIQTRKVSFPELNDSKWIALCIYNVVVLSPVGVVVVMATEDKPEVNYALESSMIFLLTTMTQSLIFFPKIIAYKNHNRSLTTMIDVELKACRLKRILSCLCLTTTSFKQQMVSNSSTSSFESSQQTQEMEICFEASDHVGIKHHNKTKIPLGTSKSVSPERSKLRNSPQQKSAEAKMKICDVAHISYRASSKESPFRDFDGAGKRSGNRNSRCMRFKVFGNGYLYKSRSDSNVSVVSSETIAQYIEEDYDQVFQEIHTSIKPWRSLTTLPAFCSTPEPDLGINALSNLKLTARFKATWMKTGDVLSQKRIEEFLKEIK